MKENSIILGRFLFKKWLMVVDDGIISSIALIPRYIDIPCCHCPLEDSIDWQFCLSVSACDSDP